MSKVVNGVCGISLMYKLAYYLIDAKIDLSIYYFKSIVLTSSFSANRRI